MPKVIFTDIKRVKKTERIHLHSEPLAEFIEIPHQNALDLSRLDHQLVCYTQIHLDSITAVRPSVKDVSSKKNKQKFLFLAFDTAKENLKKISNLRANELIRFTSAALVILLVINFFNIYQRGIQLKSDLITSASSGYKSLMSAGSTAKDANFSDAEINFTEAKKNFDQALSQIDNLNSSTDSIFLKEKNVDSVNNFLQAGKAISTSGEHFTKGIVRLQSLPSLFLKSLNSNTSTFSSPDKGRPGGVLTTQISLTDQLKQDLKEIEGAIADLTKAEDFLNKVDQNVIPKDYQEKFFQAKDTLNKLNTVAKQAKDRFPAALKLLGDRYPYRYLILLQNNTEARPTGGFIGSFMIVDINDGRITKNEFHDVYTFDGQLKEDVPAPDDIAKVTKNWRLRDSNYSPDFVISAQKAAWFLQKEKGPSVDAVIAINQSVIAKLLGSVGEISLPNLQSKLNQDNFQLVLSYLIESKFYGKENPKQILQELIPAFQNKLFENGNFSGVVKALIEELQQKNILLYSRDADVEDLFDHLGFSGRQKAITPKQDFLQVIITSIGGNKSDLYIRQDLTHDTMLTENGKVTNELTISREHQWTEKDLEDWQRIMKKFGYSDFPDYLKDILGRGQNKSIIKVYVPKGSKLTNALGIDQVSIITKDDDLLNKTYFMFEMNIFPGNGQKVILRYDLPENLKFNPADTYSLNVQKQPGQPASHLSKSIIPSVGLSLVKNFPTTATKSDDGSITYQGDLNQDTYFSALLSN